MPDPCRLDRLDPCPDGPCPCRTPTLPPPLICQGRPWTADGQPGAGKPCGETYRLTYVPGEWEVRGCVAVHSTRLPTADEQVRAARAAGWLVDPIPTCPACRRPARGPLDITQYQTTERT